MNGNKPQRPTPAQMSPYVMMQRMEEERRAETKRALRALDWASGLIAIVIMALACVPVLGALAWIMMMPACLLILILSIISLAKGGLLSGIVGIGFALVVIPLWCVFVPLVVQNLTEQGRSERLRAYPAH